MAFDIDYIKKVAAISEREMERIEKYYSKLCREEKIEVEKIKSDIYFQRKIELEKGKKAEFNYSIFLISIKKIMIRFEKIERTKQPDQTTILRINEIKIARLREEKQSKIAPNAAWINKHISDIHELRAQGLSWAEISLYVKKYYKKNISKSYLRDVFTEFSI